ncbi:isochorismate synthase, chloroplastic isoform X1 [Dendrobium catenatum]|uniref:isochorismate synthase, chloroplastic isoform X1 n=1 Tax=Dendrobium catenatum TaxID=906689 RepID=UPI0009F60EF6|nr:isochorismate synthase, chloroplastic isoform X1 [Dendrobium catenatum]
MSSTIGGMMWQGYHPCSVYTNGNGGTISIDQPLIIHETRTLPAVAVAESAFLQLNLAITALRADPPRTNSGIIRLEVPIMEKARAIDWLHAQHHLPCCYFSGRGQNRERDLIDISGNEHGGYHDKDEKCFVSVAGVGSAVSFRGSDPFGLEDWKCIKRFLSKDCPLVRAYGAIRFDAKRNISTEWKEFGSFYFIIPQVEFDEFEDGSMLATTIAWDDYLLLTWEKAVNGLIATMNQLLGRFDKLEKSIQRTATVGCSHVPCKASWNDSVTKALEIINRRHSDLVKVVLARCSRYVTDSVIDPLVLLASLQIEGENAYQFYIQPPNAPAFIGNTPEKLFHRKFLNISSEALAGTRARGVTKIQDFQNGQDLLYSRKDDIEFTIVRDIIRAKLETICDEVIIDPRKALRRLPGVQHLCAELFGKLRRECDEFDVLASLHPSPAVCGMPSEEARKFIEEHEKFDRGMYAGPVGWFGGSESEFAVGIRSALVGQDLNTLVFAGAGIVKGTVPSLEWEEVDLKISQFTKVLHRHELQECLKEIKNAGTVANGD